MKRIGTLLRRNGLLSFALLGLIIGSVLQLAHQRYAAHWVLGSFAAIGGIAVFYQAIQHVRGGGYGLDILAFAAVVAGIWQHQTWTAIVVVIVWCLNRLMLQAAERRVSRRLRFLESVRPHGTEVIRARKTVSAKAQEVHAGDKIIIVSGAVVPADAVIIDGTSDFNETALTGEQALVSRTVGDVILAGSINQGNAVNAKVSASLADSQYSQLVKIVRAAHHTSAPFSRLSARYSLPFTVMAFAVASAMWAISHESIRFLDVLVVATPFPLIAATPLALTGGILRASRYGIIIKSASILQRLAETETVVFEKTGLLSSQGFAVSDVQNYHGFSKTEVISLAASLEQQSDHTVGQAIVAYAQQQGVKLVKTKHVRVLESRGLSTHLKGRDLLIGNLRLMQESNILLPKSVKSESTTAAYLAIGGELAAVFTLDSAADAQTTGALARLKALRLKHFVMITGDSKAAAEALAKQLGINEVHADLEAGDKLHIIERIMRRPVTFVGDGVHDVAAMTASDVSVALDARGNTHAAEAANVIVLSPDLNRVATAAAIAQHTFKLAFTSIVIGVILTLALIALFATGALPPVAGAAAQLVVTLVTAASAIRTAQARGESL